MRKHLILLVVLPVLLGVIPGCEEIPYDPEIPELELSQKTKMLIEADNAFGFTIFREIVNSEPAGTNLTVSPLSISLALAMTYNGSDGTTREAMTEVLNLQGLTTEEINSAYRYLIAALVSLDPRVKLTIANSIWYRNTFPVEQEFLDINANSFGAEVRPLDFNDPASVDIINDWVAESTNDKIMEIIDGIDPLDVMFLINAIYFKGIWTYRFEEKNTAPMDFHPEDGSVKQVPFMVMEADLPYFSNDLVEAIELPYGQGSYSMFVLLPREGLTTGDVADHFTPENWESWLEGFQLREGMTIKLPKFRFEYEKTLNEVLSAMGMGIAFSPMEADFSKINPDRELYISEVKHKTFIDVNEEGTEAAAVTSVTITTTSIGPSNVFCADRPFFFVIRENQSGAIIFSGRVALPVSGE